MKLMQIFTVAELLRFSILGVRIIIVVELIKATVLALIKAEILIKNGHYGLNTMLF